MKKLLSLLVALGLTTFERRIKRVVSGIGLMVLSGFFGMVAVVFLLMSMFFGFADMDNLILPSVITGGVIILVAIVVAIEGMRLVKK